jgi:hypothetical protein
MRYGANNPVDADSQRGAGARRLLPFKITGTGDRFRFDGGGWPSAILICVSGRPCRPSRSPVPGVSFSFDREGVLAPQSGFVCPAVKQSSPIGPLTSQKGSSSRVPWPTAARAQVLPASESLRVANDSAVWGPTTGKEEKKHAGHRQYSGSLQKASENDCV